MATRNIFKFKLPLWKRLFNRVDNANRLSLIIMGGLTVTFSGLIVEALRNGSIAQARDEWIVTKVRDPNNKDFAKLDEEAPPQPLVR